MIDTILGFKKLARGLGQFDHGGFLCLSVAVLLSLSLSDNQLAMTANCVGQADSHQMEPLRQKWGKNRLSTNDAEGLLVARTDQPAMAR